MTRQRLAINPVVPDIPRSDAGPESGASILVDRPKTDEESLEEAHDGEN